MKDLITFDNSSKEYGSLSYHGSLEGPRKCSLERLKWLSGSVVGKNGTDNPSACLRVPYLRRYLPMYVKARG